MPLVPAPADGPTAVLLPQAGGVPDAPNPGVGGTPGRPVPLLGLLLPAAANPPLDVPNLNPAPEPAAGCPAPKLLRLDGG